MKKVYLLKTEDDLHYKIGYTEGSVSKRIESLQTGNPKKILLVNTFETDIASKVESALHKNHGHKRLEGEWFELSKDDVDSFIKNCSNIEESFNFLINSGNPFI